MRLPLLQVIHPVCIDQSAGVCWCSLIDSMQQTDVDVDPNCQGN